MKAVVWKGVGDIGVENVPDPKIEEPTDACDRAFDRERDLRDGPALHPRHRRGDESPGTMPGHEGVGLVEEVGKSVRNLRVGDHVVIPYDDRVRVLLVLPRGVLRRAGTQEPQGDAALRRTPKIPRLSGSAGRGLRPVPFRRTPSGPLQATRRNLDDQAILMPTFSDGYFGHGLARSKQGDPVAVFGCGPVGQFAIASARLLGAGESRNRRPKSRLEMASRGRDDRLRF